MCKKYKKLRCYMIFGIIFTIAVGSLMHYAYEWSGNSFIIGLIAPVNESTWEHMKLVFFPMLVYSIFSICKLKEDYPCIISGLSIGLLLATFLIPVLYYTYTGILGFHVLWVDITIFIFCVVIGFIAAYRTTINCFFRNFQSFFLFLVILTTICFFLFTIKPPQLGLFQIP